MRPTSSGYVPLTLPRRVRVREIACYSMGCHGTCYMSRGQDVDGSCGTVKTGLCGGLMDRGAGGSFTQRKFDELPEKDIK